MNAPVLAVSVMSLGIMMGITATHFQHVNHLVKHGVPSVIKESSSEVEANGSGKESVVLAKSIAATKALPGNAKSGIRQRHSSARTNTAPSHASAREDVLLEILASMREEQKAIRQQLSESNRDIDELTFRVDTHSDSFKPLHSTEMDRPHALGNGGAVNAADSLGTGLLPPKQ